MKLRTQWLPVAVNMDDKEASLLLLSLYMGKLMGVGKGVGELKMRVSSSHGLVESRLVGKAEKGWVVGEGLVVVVNSLEEKVSLEVVDVQRDKVLGQVIVEVAKDSAALVKRQWGKRPEVKFFLSCFPHHKKKSLPQEYLEVCHKAFPLAKPRDSPHLKEPGRPSEYEPKLFIFNHSQL